MNPKIKAMESVQQLVGTLDPKLFVTALFASVVSAFVASFLYRIFYERKGTGSQVNRAFPLLGLSVTTLFICVQVSLPLSLGLLGALSIIRFRTPIKEPEEVGFIMLVIASSIVCATFNFHFLVILYVLTVLTLVAIRGWKGVASEKDSGMAIVVGAGEDAGEMGKAVEGCLDRLTRNCLLESTSGKDGTVTFQFSFAGLRGSATELQAEIQKTGDIRSVNIFLNRPGSVV